MTTLILVRHGQTDWNLERRYQGKTDIPLNGNGRRQAAHVAEQLRNAGLAAVYSSALGRAYVTASAIAAAHGLVAIKDARLNEIDQGEWEGLRHDEIAKRYAECLRCWEEDPTSTCPPGGESLAVVRERVLSFLKELTKKHPDGSVCVVGHKVTNATIKSEILGLPIGQLMRQEPLHAGWEKIEIPNSRLRR